MDKTDKMLLAASVVTFGLSVAGACLGIFPLMLIPVSIWAIAPWFVWIKGDAQNRITTIHLKSF